MIKWLQGCFCVPKEGKVSEKVFLSRIALNITMIVICMLAMAFTAFAYFSADIASQKNRIQAAHFDVEVYVSFASGETTVSEPVNRESTDVYLVNMKADTVYKVEVIAKGNANTGFVVVSAGGYQYHTEQLVINDKDSVVFYLKPTEDMTVMMMPHWGTSSRYEAFLAETTDAYYLRDDPTGSTVKELAVSVP